MQSSMIPVGKGKKLKGVINANHRLALELTITKKLICAQTQPSCEKRCDFKSLGEKVVKSKVAVNKWLR